MIAKIPIMLSGIVITVINRSCITSDPNGFKIFRCIYSMISGKYFGLL